MAKVFEYEVTTKETDRWGLLCEFSVEPKYNDGVCWTEPCGKCAKLPDEKDFSTSNQAVLKSCIEPWMRSIVEIGICREDWETSSTRILIENRHKDCKYFGIDLDNREFVKDHGDNIFFQRNSSWNVDENIAAMKEFGIEQIDLLMIDGDHSVNSLLKEWDYTKILSPNGVIVLHDTNFHAGPWCIMEYADPEIFDKRWECESLNDFGIGVLKRKK